MDLDVLNTAVEAESCSFSRRLAVVIDVLRATTTTVAALERGAISVRPVRTIAEAFVEKDEDPEAILCGEREGFPIDGFDYGNSPVELATRDLTGSRIVLTTTNGTRSAEAARVNGPATELIAMCLLNVGAVADHICGRLGAEGAGWVDGVTIICAGTDERYSIDDAYAASLLVRRLESTVDELSDAAWAVRSLAESPLAEVVNATSCRHVRVLRDKGFEKDVDFG